MILVMFFWVNPIQRALKRADFACRTLLLSYACLWSLHIWFSLLLSCPDWPFLSDYPFCHPVYIVSPESWLITAALKLETAHFFKMLASTSQFTWHYNPKEYQKYTINLPLTIAFYGKCLKNYLLLVTGFYEQLPVYLSLLLVSDKSACVSQSTATI
jgi:hypothetical protein